MDDNRSKSPLLAPMTRREMVQRSCHGAMGMIMAAGFGGTAWTGNTRWLHAGAVNGAAPSSGLRIVDRELFDIKPRAESEPPHWHGALYAEPTGSRLLSPGGQGWVSDDNGHSWKHYKVDDHFSDGLPYGYRRNVTTSVLDTNTHSVVTIVNAMDTPGLDPKQIEPPVAQFTYYLRYRVSRDGGRSWLFDEPIIGHGRTALNPFDGIIVGKSAFYIGDAGSKPLVTREGKVLVPCQTTPLGPDGEPYNPGKALTYTDVVVLIGSWTGDGHLRWQSSQRVKGDPARSTRGMIEPTLAEMPDGRLLMVMRGSNGHGADPDFKLPSHKWVSVSADGGRTWSQPKPWTYDDGTAFFSPSSMSSLVAHSSGRIFWIGNISDQNCHGNLPRWPLVMGEVDPTKLTLIRDSVLVLDRPTAADADRGRVDLSHVNVVEDRQNGEFVVTFRRGYQSYKIFQYCKLRIALDQS